MLNGLSYRCCGILLVLSLTSCVVGCVVGKGAGTLAETDSGPVGPVEVGHIPDAKPRYEVRTKAGNTSPYTVLGKTYTVLADSVGYRAQGEASWYGRKFHGRKTANGETYDMYAMTAAHKSLPIPSYVRVRNLSNNREVVVRINDRGPFHGGRIIDLSYTAAKKLGFHDLGTAQVEVVAIDVSNPNAEPAPIVAEPSTSDGYAYLQAGAFGSASGAMALEKELAAYTGYPVQVLLQESLYKVRIGPIDDEQELVALRERIRNAQVAEPYVVYD